MLCRQSSSCSSGARRKRPGRPLLLSRRCLCALAVAAAVVLLQPAAAGRTEDASLGVVSSSSQSSSSSSTPSRFESPIAHGAHYANATAGARLTPWEAAVSGQPECKRGAWAEMARGAWHMDADGEVLYEPRTCKLRRLSGDAARRCLAGKTLAFIGGSLARYQYMNLAFFLSHRQHMQRYADDPAQRSLVIEKQWANFTHYYAAGSALLGWEDAAGAAAEHCHCHRLGTFGSSYEHRLLTVNFSTAAASGSPRASLRVVYNQTFGIKKNVALDTAEAVAWNLGEGASTTPSPAADFVVVNLGHWANHNLKQQVSNYTDVAAAYEPIFAAARDARRAGNKRTRFVWRTTTHARAPTAVGPDSFSNWNPLWHRLLTGLARFHRWEVYDGHAVTRAMLRAGVAGHWDNLHFLPFVYDQLNDVLLNGLC